MFKAGKFSLLALLAGAMLLMVSHLNCGRHFDLAKPLELEFASLLDPIPEAAAPAVSSPMEITVPEKSKHSLLYMMVNSTMKTGDWQKDAIIDKEWKKIRESYLQYAKSSIGNPANLYNVQILLSAFAQYAYERNHAPWMYDLMNIYLESGIPAATVATSLKFYYPDISGSAVEREKVLPISRPMKVWAYPDTGAENVINSSQFLYPVTMALLWIAKNDLYNKNDLSKRFFDAYYNLALRDHLQRWIFNRDIPVGSFQLRGWGCANGSYSHAQHLRNLLKRAYGTSKTYCNALLDMDLFILENTAHLLSIYKLKSGSPEVTMTAAEYEELVAHLKLGMDVVQSRLTYAMVNDPNGAAKEVAYFSLGDFDGHPDHAYAGDTDGTFPGWDKVGTAPRRKPRPSTKTGWDISHGRRLVNLTWTLRETNPSLQVISPVLQGRIEAGFANLMAYKVFNGSLSEPKFTNYMDGTNGWYRVNYSSRPGFGYAPWSMSASFIDAGYGAWDVANPEIGEIMNKAVAHYGFKSSGQFGCLQILSALPTRYFPELLQGPRAADGSVCSH